ncbi:MAG: TetR family transcriptional regulator [Halanaerobium sp. MDAL1]|nr:MAG: TetR family transcriptional regulator [Halanaerobium sp. MDAL1]
MSEDTRTKILTSAVQVFSKSNYHAVSMSEIAEGAGISKGTLYWHFNSKEDLFREITIDGMNYFNDKFKKISKSDKNSKEKIYNLIKCVLDTFVDHLNMIDVFRNNVELISSEFKNTLEVKHQKNINIVAEIIEQGIDEGVIKCKNNVDMASLILSVLFTPQTKELLDRKTEIKNQVDFIYDFIIYGISRKEN